MARPHILYFTLTIGYRGGKPPRHFIKEGRCDASFVGCETPLGDLQCVEEWEPSRDANPGSAHLRLTFICRRYHCFHGVSPRKASAQELPAGAQEVTVLEAIDGEKMKVKIGPDEKMVRLIANDAPEEKNADGNPECGFESAKQNLINTVTFGGRKVFIEADEEDKDGKDRLWRHVWVSNEDGITFALVNEYLLESGSVALQAEVKNKKYADRYQQAASMGKEAKAGLYTECGGLHVAVNPDARHGSKDDPGVLGERLEASGMAVTLQTAFAATSYGYSVPRGGYKFLIVGLYIENITDETKGYADDRVKAKNLDNNAEYKDVYQPTDQPLDSGDLSPGSYISGLVIVEIQETAHNLRFEYKINAFGGDIVYWNISV